MSASVRPGSREVAAARAWLACWARGACDERGNVTVQSALMVPIIFMVFFLPLQTGIWVYARNVASAAAALGATTAAADRPGAEQEGKAAAVAMLRNSAAQVDSVTIARGAEVVTVEVRASMVSLIPGLPLHVAQTSRAPLERFVGAPGA